MQYRPENFLLFCQFVAGSILFQVVPTFSKSLKPVRGCSRLSQVVSACSSLFHSVLGGYSSFFILVWTEMEIIYLDYVRHTKHENYCKKSAKICKNKKQNYSQIIGSPMHDELKSKKRFCCFQLNEKFKRTDKISKAQNNIKLKQKKYTEKIHDFKSKLK